MPFSPSVFVAFLTFVVANCNVILFTSYFVSRDHAQFCCDKYGMSLMKISNKGENDIMESFLRTIPGTSEIWIGLFQDPADNDTFIWADGMSPTWLSWENGTLSNSTYNDTLCIKAELGETNGLYWKVADCGDKLEYACQVGLNRSNLVPTLDDAICPKLLKLTGKNINRNDTTQLHGYFEINDQIFTMGTQLGSHIVSNSHPSTECAIRCLNMAGCSEVILIADLLCILYSDV